MMEPAFNYEGLPRHGQVNRKQTERSARKTIHITSRSRQSTAGCIRNNKEPLTPGEEGLRDMLTIEAIYQAVGAPIAEFKDVTQVTKAIGGTSFWHSRAPHPDG